MSKIDSKIREYIISWVGKDLSDEDIEECILDLPTIFEGDPSYRRWWQDVFCVCKLGDMLIGYWGARTTGDDSPRDKGWEFDPSTICEVEEYEVISKGYRKKKI